MVHIVSSEAAHIKDASERPTLISEEDADDIVIPHLRRDSNKNEKEKSGGSDQSAMETSSAAAAAATKPVNTSADKENISTSASDRRGSSQADKRRASQISGISQGKKEKEPKEKQSSKKKNSASELSVPGKIGAPVSNGPSDLLSPTDGTEKKRARHSPVVTKDVEEV
ncbi:hypothetical protein PoB_000557900 [Plakobranchus ocellatus]|uniref:Uncharacterized protein n=1 Tax=Plakobranchus ocellatus TaxID=259542 RepID=A0AAV3YAI7_9GAST|nr:hypothetical protein PoB_000557900 [Plakobranchus ocellatus]